MTAAPQVSIGLPVYNGERFLARALDSLLAQTFESFEIVIADNNSTDATPAICHAYAARDPRIRYHRNATNVGAARNFNLAFTMARGEYFKWAAHDDLVAASFLSKAVEILSTDLGVVLCHSMAGVINEVGVLQEPDVAEVRADSSNPAERFRAALFGPRCYEVFGLIRAEALRRTDLIGLYARGDGVLLARLALLGRFALIPEGLLFVRRHATQSMAMVNDYHAYARWFDPSQERRFVFPDWRICVEYLRVLRGAPLTPKQYLSCLGTVAQWGMQNRRRLVRDLRVAAEMACFGNSDPARRKLFRLSSSRLGAAGTNRSANPAVTSTTPPPVQ